MSEQLEFDLWVEERITELDLVRHGGRNELARRACIYGQAEAIMFHDPKSLDIIVRYRI